MCGIAGVISKNNIKAFDKEKIKSLMYSRGPDKQDSFISNENGVSLNLYASRLKILDIDERSDQPFKFDESIFCCVPSCRRFVNGFRFSISGHYVHWISGKPLPCSQGVQADT